jgi:hypothetical protein
MATVTCKLTDCKYRGMENCTAKRVAIDGCGMVECYEPMPRSTVVHEQFNSRCSKTQRGYKSDRVKIFK